jgi:hypothetical protein
MKISTCLNGWQGSGRPAAVSVITFAALNTVVSGGRRFGAEDWADTEVSPPAGFRGALPRRRVVNFSAVPTGGPCLSGPGAWGLERGAEYAENGIGRFLRVGVRRPA